jgi:hypothetical protein
VSHLRWVTLGTAVLVAAFPAASSAQPAPGSEFRVNTYTTSDQSGAEVAADARGFVVSWQSYRQDGDRNGIFARRFDRLGRPRGPEIAVNQVTADNQMLQSVASDARGNFVVSWRRTEPGGFRLMARRFDRAGAALGPEFDVSAPMTNQQLSSWVAMQPDGRFLVAWTQNTPSAVAARRFDAAGNPVGAELTLSTPTSTVHSAHVSAAPDGGYLVTWTRAAAGGRDARGRRVDAAGAPAGVEFQVKSSAGGYDDQPTSSFDDSGAFVVAWSKAPNGASRDVFARRFDAAGTPLGGDILVNAGVSQYCCPNLVSDRDGGFAVVWTGGAVEFDVFARRFGPTGAPLETQFVLPADSALFQGGGASARAPGGHLVATYSSSVADGSPDGVLGRLLGVVPMAMAVDVSPMQSNGNGVLEAGETVAVAPAWANADRTPLGLAGTLSSFAGPGASTYTLADATAAYGTLPLTATGSCSATANCYALAVSTPPTRPAVHWDASVRERLSPRGDMTWSLHVGGSFADVPASVVFYPFVETLLHHGVTAGCAGGTYCPSAFASREQMAVFVLSAQEGAGYQPRACGTPLFPDVPASSPFCPFVEELARRGVVGGCGGGDYCPGSPVTREEMAVFVLRTKEPDSTPPACTTPMFGDVPASSPFCRWIEELARRAVVSGCGGGNYCPTAAVTREHMAVFIAGGFGLTLYGP